ncbi:SIMPL domain-containing protein [Flavobacteriaceae bacterium M23B6Z8]
MMKNYFLPFLLLFVSVINAQQKNFIDQPYLETSASVDTLVVPDRIYLNIEIFEKDTRGKISVEETENKMKNVLQGLGINTQKQLTLSDLQSNFQNRFLAGKEVMKHKSYLLLVYDAQTAGKVIQALEVADISNVALQRVDYSKKEELGLKLKAKAIEKAKNQAEVMLRPLGQQLGKALFISDQHVIIATSRASGINTVYSENYSRIKTPINIDFEKIKIQSTINIKFSIE